MNCHIQIMPVKMLYSVAQDADLTGCAALLVSSWEVRRELLETIPHVLILSFDDIVAGERAFTPALADQIALFLEVLPEDVDTLFVCCDSGQSRSAAMAAAIRRAYDLQEMKVWRDPRYRPNALVYSTLCDALGVGVTQEQLRERVEINEHAFAAATGRN